MRRAFLLAGAALLATPAADLGRLLRERAAAEAEQAAEAMLDRPPLRVIAS